jgi:hypothetical protein
MGFCDKRNTCSKYINLEGFFKYLRKYKLLKNALFLKFGLIKL